MAKYGMSMCVLGMAEEFKKDRIAVNALWPRTAIYTAAMAMLGGGDAIKPQCRNDKIMADAAYVILSKDSAEASGNFYVDDEVLRDVGVTDFDQYAFEPGHPLLPDFFLEEAESPEQVARRIAEHGGKPKYSGGKQGKTVTPAGATPSSGQVKAVFDTISKLLNAETASDINAVYAFKLSGSEPGDWHMTAKKDNPASCGQGNSPVGDADCTMTMDSADFVKMFQGKLKPTAAFMGGKLKIQGNMGKAMKLEKLMGQLKGKL